MLLQKILYELFNSYRGNFLLFILFYFTAVIFYYPTFDSRVVFDQAEFIVEFEKQGFWGVFKCFHMNCITSLYIYHLVEFLLYKFFGAFSMYNGLFAVFIHSLNAFLIVLIFRVFSEKYHLSQNVFSSIVIGFLFLLCPYASEVVVWGCTYNYLCLQLFLLLSIYFIYKNIITLNNRYKYVVFLFFNLSLYTHEISFVFIPVLFLIYYLFQIEIGFKKNCLAFLTQYAPILVASMLICFTIRHIEHGSIIGHYGAKVHLTFDIKQLLINFNLYLLKYTFLFNNIERLNPLREFIHLHIWRYFIIELCVIISAIYCFRKKLFKLELAILFFIFCILIFPSLNLYFPDYHKIQGDRYGYVASSILFIFIGILFIVIFENRFKFIKYSLFLVLIVASGFILRQYNESWKIAAQLMSKIENTDLGKGNRYFFLNMPESYKGAYMYKTGNKISPFKFRFQVLKMEWKNEIDEVLSMNLTSLKNKLNVTKLDSISYYINIENPNGSWFWKGNVGAYDYETAKFSVKMDEWGGYKLSLKKMPLNSYLLYYTDGKLSKIKIN
jgi:hypothetical protein